MDKKNREEIKKMRFPEKSIKICCDYEKCPNGFHTMFHLSKSIQICKKLAINSNLVIENQKNDTLVINTDNYLVEKGRFVK